MATKSSSKGHSARAYAKNPASKKKKYAYDKKYNAKPENKAKRRELVKSNREHDKKYGKGSRAGKDAAHQKDGSIKYINSSKNRANQTTTAGDRKARGKKKK